MFKVIGFYTKGTPYEEEVKGLIGDCESLGIPHHFKGIESLGSWVRNCAQKPKIILEMLSRFPEEDLVYLDVDARIRSYPRLFQSIPRDTTIGVHFRETKELLSGTIYLRNSPECQRLVQLWLVEQITNPNEWDQKTLQHVLEREKFRIHQLPPTYCQIFDTMKGPEPPVIEHFQASRRFKTLINEGTKGVGARIRILSDGSFAIPRGDRVLESQLDTIYQRCPNELRWIPRGISNSEIEGLSPLFKNQWVFIIGKGPSLNGIDSIREILSLGPIICINESIHKVEAIEGLDATRLFAIQQDSSLRDTCRPKKGRLLISEGAKNWYPENKFVFDPSFYGFSSSELSVICAIEIAKQLGARGYFLIGFDAAITGDCSYAQDIVSKRQRNPRTGSRFLGHKKRIQESIPNELGLYFIQLRDQRVTIYDRFLQPICNPISPSEAYREVSLIVSQCIQDAI